MSDQINAKGSDSKFKPHEAGQYVAQCVDCVDLGDNVETFAGQPPKLAHKCALVFRTGERNEATGDYIDIAREFTVSMGEKANLRKFLEQWRGKPYATDQIEAGVPLHKLTGQHALLTIAQQTSKQGRKYAMITACVGVPKQMQGGLGSYTDYTRADYWTEKKQTYADAARKFRAEQAQPSADDDWTPDDTGAVDDDSSLPF